MNFMESWREFLNNDLLLEGRKENAAAMIVKKIDDPRIRMFLIDFVLNNIITADPTPNKKYIEWAARRIAEVARKEIDDNYMLTMGQAINDPEGMKPGGPGDKEYTPERMKIIQGYTDQQRLQGGYLTNQERYLRYLDDAKVNIENRVRVIVTNLSKYHKYAERNLMNKNIDSYKEIYEWEHEVFKAEKEEREREEMKRREAGAKETTDYLHDDEDYMIVRPRSEDSSCYYGRGTKWCISATQSRNYFAQYTGEGTGFYFVLFKHTPQKDSFKKMAMVFTAADSEPSEVFDAADEPHDPDAIRDAAELNLLSKGIKEAFGGQMKKMKGKSRVEFYNETFDDVIDEYDRLIKNRDIRDDVPEGTEDDAPGVPESSPLHGVLVALGVDAADLKRAENIDVVEEYISEIVSDHHMDIVGEGIAHFENNPAGPSMDDFQAEQDKYDFTHVFAHFDEYDEARMYFDGGMSLDADDIHEDYAEADDDVIEDSFRKFLEDLSIYPDEVEVYQGQISVRFNPDYDEAEGLSGWENFLSRMDDYDERLKKAFGDDMAETIEFFQDLGVIAAGDVKLLYQKFIDMDLDNFDIDIEDKDISIYKTMKVTVPMPAHLYKGLTGDTASWQTANRADITKSASLMAFANLIAQRSTEYSDQLIAELQQRLDMVFNRLVQRADSWLPGLDNPPENPSKEKLGLVVPEYNIGIYKTAHSPTVTASGLQISYFLDVRLETEDEESYNENTVEMVARFLKIIDKGDLMDKVQVRLQRIIEDDVVKNIIPQFEEGGEEPQMDPVTGRVTSRSERESDEYKKQQAVDELGTMFESKNVSQNNVQYKKMFDSWRSFTKQ